MTATLALNQIRIQAAQFARDWANSPGDERQDAHSFVQDLLTVYGITATKAAFYEKRVKRASTGTQGYIDALIPGLALIEMKSAGKDLVKAEAQALDYINGLSDAEAPRYVLTSDFRNIRILDLQAPDGEPGTAEFALADLPQQADRLAFFAGYLTTTATATEQEAASVRRHNSWPGCMRHWRPTASTNTTRRCSSSELCFAFTPTTPECGSATCSSSTSTTVHLKTAPTLVCGSPLSTRPLPGPRRSAQLSMTSW
jgi:hypothetical protein